MILGNYLLRFTRALQQSCHIRSQPVLGVFAIFSLLVCFVWLNTQPELEVHDSALAFRQDSGSAQDNIQQTSSQVKSTLNKTGLRVLLPHAQEAFSSKEAELLRQYAAEQGTELVWLRPGDESQVIEHLRKGKGDIALGRSISSESKIEKHDLEFTLPWGVSQQQVISRSDTGRINHLQDLGTRQIALRKSSPLWSYLRKQTESNTAMSLVVIPESESLQEVLQKVANAQYDVTIIDNLLVESALDDYLNLEVAFNASEADMMSWAVRASDVNLIASLNGFISRQYLQSQIAQSYKEDLPGLQSRKLLRLITYQSPSNYYLHAGKLKGFEHDLAKRFAESHKLRLDVVVADSHAHMQELLLQGKGDLIAASLPRGSVGENIELQFSRSYSHAAPVVVGRSQDSPLLDAKSLDGRRIVLPASSPYKQILQNLQQKGLGFELIVADASLNAETILYRVAMGMFDLTVIGAHEINAHFSRQINLRAHFSLSEPLPHAWAVRSTETLLLSSINDFLKKEYRKGFYNLLYTKYIDKPRALVGDTQLLAGVEKLSPYDDIVHKYAQDYDFDWRLIVAQMYQESQFDPNAISYAGAEGLMQIIPETADLLGLDDSYDPAASIQAGIRYMDYLRDKFEEEELQEDRIWFSLAAYNAGYNRVKRARKLAEKMNLNGNKWFDNVELAMLAMARPVWKNGEVERHCRCGQTVVYGRDIRTLYSNYVRLTRSGNTVSNNRGASGEI
ncbi:MAG: transporter substrate-binding domain-containing protein [Gammaproteobacteria bacterium]|nr:transporter substrate-binding domain-containing protein [Gammaproteobacteria bacterium]